MRKAIYIQEISEAVHSGEVDLPALEEMSDDDVIAELTKLRGVGVWTAEMLLTFSLQRPDVVSFGDLAIRRGMRMLYRPPQITRPLFENIKGGIHPTAQRPAFIYGRLQAERCPSLPIPPKNKGDLAPAEKMFRNRNYENGH